MILLIAAGIAVIVITGILIYNNASSDENRKAGATKTNPKDGLTYAWIPAGNFSMGCSSGDTECYDDERPQHAVNIAKGFWIGQTEVTQAAYERVMGSNPSKSKGANQPVESITWDEAQNYCHAIGGRLPTEAEWEYAARAGDPGVRYGDLNQVAWHSGNAGTSPRDVGQKSPNAWGLLDTIGNVWEWTADWYDEAYYAASPGSDPTGGAPGKERTARGGSFVGMARYDRVSNRGHGDPQQRYAGVGIRCVSE